jgi:histidine ammonia-lyase
MDRPCVIVDGESLTLRHLYDVSEGKATVRIAEECHAPMKESEDVVRGFVEKDMIVYGVTTGFGHLARTAVEPSKAKDLQRNLIVSHCTGVGKPFSIPHVRGAMLLRINSLVQGYSGIRLSSVQLIADFLNNDIVPYVPQQGSVGASGDLAPLSHVALSLIGEGKVFFKGELIPTEQALKATGLVPITLIQKEGLALINGTQFMTAVLGHTLVRAYAMFEWAIAATSLSLDALQASINPFDPRIHRIRPHPGQMYAAERIRQYLLGSEVGDLQTCKKVQDAYSLRTSPQVMGAIKDTLDHARRVVECEMNSVTDNPLIIDGEVFQSGNFHGEPIALVSDFVAIAFIEVGNISERRIDRLVNPLVSDLPPFLAHGEAGLNSGYMIWQYTAAALASENKTMAFPASADSIPTSAYQEDHVSMGTIAARKACKVLDNLERIVAIELMIAARAMEYHAPRKTGVKLRTTLAAVMQHLAPNTSDRVWCDEFEAVLKTLKETTCPGVSELSDEHSLCATSAAAAAGASHAGKTVRSTLM